MSKAKRTKQFIIDRTAVLFNKKGFAGTSLTDLTDATGLTKGSIYGNFHDKQEVAIAAFNHNHQILIKQISTKMAKEQDSVGKLLAMIKAYENICDEMLDYGGCPIINTAIDADDTNKLLHDRTIKAFADWKHSIVSILSKGKQQKEVADSVDESSIAELLIVQIEGGLALAKATGNKSYFTNATAHARQLLDRVKARNKEMS